MKSIVDILSKNIAGSLASVYTIYATTFAAIAALIAFIHLHRESEAIDTYKLGNIWPIKASISLAIISVITLQISSLLIIVLDVKEAGIYYCILKILLLASWFSFAMLGVIYFLVLKVANQMLKYFPAE